MAFLCTLTTGCNPPDAGHCLPARGLSRAYHMHSFDDLRAAHLAVTGRYRGYPSCAAARRGPCGRRKLSG